MNRRMACLAVALVAAVAASLALPGAGFAYSAGWSTTVGTPQTVFDPNNVPDPGSTGQCKYFYPDGPVRALSFVNKDGQTRVQMDIANNSWNHRLVGSSLDTLTLEQLLTGDERRPCGAGYDLSGNVVFRAKGDKIPDTYQNYEWLFAPYLASDGTIYSLVHNEFHGAQGQPDPTAYCPAGDTNPVGDCWLASLNLATSTGTEANDTSGTPCTSGGTTGCANALGARFSQAASPNQLVAAIPWRYDQSTENQPCQGMPASAGNICFGRRGYGGNSNIVYTQRPGDGRPYYYAIMSANPYPSANPVQKTGTCLMRTANIADPSSWRAWGYGGQSTLGFNVQFADPYLSTFDQTPSAHVCEPVSPSTVAFYRWSLTYDTYLQKYMLVSNSTENGVYGIYYSLSDDLINWSSPQLITTAPAIYSSNCSPNTVGDEIDYGTILDSNDPARDPHAVDPNTHTVNSNFDHPGRTPYLYYTRLGRDQACQTTGSSSLSRMPITFEQRQATLEPDGAITGNDHAYDSRSSNFFFSRNDPRGSIFPGAYGGSGWYAQAQMYGTFTDGVSQGSVQPPHGTINVKWNEGDDVWYSSAFYLGPDFFTNNGDTDILRWEDASGNDYGGIGLRKSDRKLHLVSGRPGTDTSLITINGVPTQRWVWLEVHQRLSSTSSGSPVSEVYLDGHLVGSSLAPNRYQEGGTISQLHFGFAKVDPLWKTYTYMYVDRSTVLGAQRGPIGAPATPIGLQASSTNNSATLSWNPVSPVVSGDTVYYRVYERDPNTTDGNWIQISTDPVTSTSFRDDGFCNTRDYRVTAYETNSVDSPGATATPKESNFSVPLSVQDANPTC